MRNHFFLRLTNIKIAKKNILLSKPHTAGTCVERKASPTLKLHVLSFFSALLFPIAANALTQQDFKTLEYCASNGLELNGASA